MRRKLLVSALACLSLANLLFLSGWRVVLNPARHASYYFWKEMPGYVEPISLIADILIIASVFFATLYLMRHSGINRTHPVISVASAVVLILVLNNLRLNLGLSGKPWVLHLANVIFIAFVLAIGALFVYSRTVLGRLTSALLLVLAPLVPIFFLQGIYLTHNSIPTQLSAVEQSAGWLSNNGDSKKLRVVWVIFDELDENTAFASRRPGLSLPSFDRLRSESFTATNALPPARWTFLSMPSLISGRPVTFAEPAGPNDLRLTFADGQNASWSTLPNVFSASRELGYSTALVGWFHPYCRVLGSSLNRCFWQTATTEIVPVVGELTIRTSMKIWFQKALFCIPGMFRVLGAEGKYNRELSAAHIQEYKNIQAAVSTTLADPALDLILLHLPVPHHPWIFDAANSTFSSGPNQSYESKPGYESNLVLADKALSEIRRQMEESGSWDRTAILISADHFWRHSPVPNGQSRDHRVAFILKLPGQSEGMRYEKPLSTIVTHDLLLRLLKRDLTTYKEVSNWLESRHDPIPNIDENDEPFPIR